jgi:hypothetical protein
MLIRIRGGCLGKVDGKKKVMGKKRKDAKSKKIYKKSGDL